MTVRRRALVLSLALLGLSGCVSSGSYYQDDYRQARYQDGDYYAPADDEYGDYYYAPAEVEYRYIETYPSYGFWRLDRYRCGYYYDSCWPYSGHSGWGWPRSGWSLFFGHGWSYGGYGSSWGWGGYYGRPWPHGYGHHQHSQQQVQTPSAPPAQPPPVAPGDREPQDRGQLRYPPRDWRERSRRDRPEPLLGDDQDRSRGFPRQREPGDNGDRPRRFEPRPGDYRSTEREPRWRAPVRVMPAPANAPGSMRYPQTAREPDRERSLPRPEPRWQAPERFESRERPEPMQREASVFRSERPEPQREATEERDE